MTYIALHIPLNLLKSNMLARTKQGKATEYICCLLLTYLRTLLSQCVVNLHPGCQVAHLPRPELLSAGHVDQILQQ